MSPVSSQCPACGSPIVFGIDTSLVTVCKACDSVVGRADQKLEDLGKVARLTETGAQLDVGRTGRFDNHRFQLTGRTQWKHEAGGVWDEWYAAFDDGRWGWLAEAQGKLYLMFEKANKHAVPSFDSLQLGAAVPQIPASRAMVVAEKGFAKAVSAEGELPFLLEPGESYAYADLSGQGAGAGSIDYSESPPKVFLGKIVTLEELGMRAERRAEPKRTVEATQVSCPHCGAPLALRAPDESKRVVCPSCDSMLDVQQGALKFLETLKQPKHKPRLALGKKAALFGADYTVSGFVARSVTYEGTKYPWEEYLLHSPQKGFRWLVCSDGHWSFGEPLEVADVQLGPYGRSARLGKESYRLFQKGKPRVDAVYGEFYWEVRLGETVEATDFIHPPHMLGCEEMKYQSGGSEVQWTKLTYVERADVEKAFGVKDLPACKGVAPNQLFPHKPIFKLWRRSMVAAFVLFLLIAGAAKETTVFERTLGFDAVATNEGTQVFFSEPFQLARGNVEIEVTAPEVDNSWVFIQGDLVQEESGLVQEFDAAVEYYHGVDDGESWSEGGRSVDAYVSSMPPGSYTMRLETQWGNFSQPITYHIRVRQDVARGAHFFLALLFLSLIPILTAIRNYTFDVRRWSQSDYSPYSSD